MGRETLKAIHQIYRLIRPEHEAAHENLLAWARWVKVKWHPQCVKSLEGRYRPPPMYEEPAPSNPPDLLLCHAIEKLISEAPNHYGEHLRMWYIRKYPLEAASRKLHIPYCQVEPHLARSREFIICRLTVK